MVAAIAAVAVTTAAGLVGRRWLAVGFDPAAARSLGAPPLPLDAVLLALIALSATAALSAVGAILVSALFVLPGGNCSLVRQSSLNPANRERRPRCGRGGGRTLGRP